MIDKWRKFQIELNAWQDTVFGHNKETQGRGAIEHMKSEAEEIIKDPKDLSEYADCLLLLLNALHCNGYNMDNLYQACKDKLKINKARTWGKRNKHGYIEHIK